MNKGESKELSTLFIDLNDRSSENSISEQIIELKKSGETQIQLEFILSQEQGIKKLQMDIDLFSRIKEIQDLPDWVIIKLILANGLLKGSSFNERISNG